MKIEEGIVERFRKGVTIVSKFIESEGSQVCLLDRKEEWFENAISC